MRSPNEGDLSDPEENSSTSCLKPITNCCDPAFAQSVFNLNEVLFPCSWRKPVWWLVTSSLIGGMVAIELLTHAFTTAAKYENFTMMGIIYAIDPVIQFITILSAQYPPALPMNVSNLPIFETNFRPNNKNPEVAIVIPAHLSANKIAATINSCLPHVEPEQIFIVDNGNNPQPMDATRDIVRGISDKINYIWGHFGNKTLAQYIGTLYAKKYRYIFTMDDDMRLPPNFTFGTESINEKVKAVCYAIVAVHPEPNKTNVLVKWQSLEYKMADCAKLSQARFGTVLYPHGAASMWERENFLEVLKQHNAIFFAEDVQLGMILERKGFQMEMVAGSCLGTEAPTTLFGPAPNFYQQRVRSWEMGRQVYFFKFLWQFLSVATPANNPLDFVLLKLFEAYAVYSNVVDWIRLPMFVLLFLNEDYWIRLAIMTAANVIPLLIWNYIKLPLNNRSDLQSSLPEILSFPLFKLLESAMSVGAIFRLLWIFGPNYTRKPNVNEMVHSMTNDPNTLLVEVMGEQLQNPDDIPMTTYKRVLCDFIFPTVEDPDDVRRCRVDSTSFRSVREMDDSDTEAWDLAADDSIGSLNYVDPWIARSPLNAPVVDDTYQSVNSASDEDEVIKNTISEKPNRNRLFSKKRPNRHNPKADIALHKWLATDNVDVKQINKEDAHLERKPRSSHFYNRPVASNPSRDEWLGTLSLFP